MVPGSTRASLVAQMVKNLPAMQETQVQSLGQEDPLEKRMATHSSLPAWGVPWTEEPGKLQSVGLSELDTTDRLTLSLSGSAGLLSEDSDNCPPQLRQVSYPFLFLPQFIQSKSDRGLMHSEVTPEIPWPLADPTAFAMLFSLPRTPSSALACFLKSWNVPS